MSVAPRPGQSTLTEESFLADRQKFWGDFTGFTTSAVIALVVLLVAMVVFLVR